MATEGQHASDSPNPCKRVPVRQAVVLIHGIGEQRPMETLRRFVDAFLERGTYHSKPDTISPSYELRRIKLRRVEESESEPGVNPDWPETDFYEYYWAHQMYGTRISHVTNWLVRTMIRGAKAAKRGDFSRDAYPPRLRWMLPIAWIGTSAALGIILWAAVRYPAQTTDVGAVVLLAGAVWKIVLAPMVGTVIADVVGDAARYLDVSPQNVARRYDIIRGGVDMLRRLHVEADTDSSDVAYHYGRIVLIGHSLGSLIAYDVLRHYWSEVNGTLRVEPSDLEPVERFNGGNAMPPGATIETHDDPVTFRKNQTECWRRINAWWLGRPRVPRDEVGRPGRARWLVTDLVTLGSPLAYAPLLLADGLADFKEKTELRELLTCPPDRSRHVNKGRFSVALAVEADRLVNFPILAHHAVFAITRWTNFYFRNDPVGGRLSPVFLKGIEECRLERLRWPPLSAHVSYWKKRKETVVPAAKPCVDRLREILKRRVTEESDGGG